MIKKIIYDYFEGIRKKKEQQDIEFKNHISPSSLMDCKRKLVYKKRNVPASNPIPAHTYIKFAMGDAVHEKITQILRAAGVEIIESETLKEAEWMGTKWVWKADDIVKVDGKIMILEKKSTYMSGWNAVERGPRADDIIQLYCYMELEKVNQGTLLYIGRDNGFMVEYLFSIATLGGTFNATVKEKVNNIKTVLLLAEKQDDYLPERDFQIFLKNRGDDVAEEFQKNNVKYKSDWRCSYCQWKNLCWQDVYEKIKDHIFYIDGQFM